MKLIRGSLPLVFLLLSAIGADAAANIDTLEPIVRKSPALGEGDDYFGYAVVVHQVERPEEGNLSDALRVTKIIAGAPIGTYPGGVPDLPVAPGAVNETGLVYLCPVIPGKCGPLSGFGTGDDLRLFDSEPNDPDPLMMNLLGLDEQKSGQFMGATLQSSGDYFMACAPRWAALGGGFFAFDSSRSFGKCFYSGRELMNFTELQPCSTGDPSFQLDESYCMAGTGATIFQPSDPSSAQFILGAPGAEQSRGRLYIYDAGDLTSRHTPQDGHNLVRRTDGSNDPIDDLYQGYSITTGTIFPGMDNIIAALPRFTDRTLTGGVRIYDAASVLSPVDVSPMGSQTGEYFGWAIATADLNGDGLDELIVGAPHYSTKARVEMGRVYVYSNNNGDLLSTPPIILEGQTVARSRFGSSVVNIGDVNNDGNEDIAVGAPYQRHSDQANGTVFIYYGDAVNTLDTTPGQVITAENVINAVEGLTEVKSFGYSLDGKVDVDANEYRDLAVGAYATQQVFLFRTLSIADIVVDMTANVEEVIVTEQSCTITNGSMFACFVVSVCASFNGKGLEGRSLETTLQLTEDVSGTDTQEARVFFDTATGLSNTYSASFVFPLDNVTQCDNISVFIIEANAIRDRLANFVVDASFETQPRSPAAVVDGNQELSDLRDFPLLRVTGTSSLAVLVDADCGDVCYSDLVLEEPKVAYLSSTGGDNPSRLIIGDVTRVQVELTYYNDESAEDAFIVQLDFCLPSFLTHNRVLGQGVVCVEDTSNITFCDDNSLNGTAYICPTLQRFLEADGENMSITLVWNVQSTNELRGDEPNFLVPLAISLPDPDMGRNQENETDRLNNQRSIDIEVVAMSNLQLSSITFSPAEATYSGANPARSGANSLGPQDLGSKIDLRVGVLNSGPTNLQEASLTVYVPINSPATGELYYIYPYQLELETLGNAGSISCASEFINPANLTADDTNTSGKKRSVVNPLVWEHRRQVMRERRSRRKRQSMQANSDTSRRCTPPNEDDCAAIQCQLFNFPSGATYRITISATLDERFFSRSEETFIFQAYAVVNISGAFDHVVEPDLSNNFASSNELRVSFRGSSDDDDVPWWVYFISIVGTLILIAIVFILLYFFGFFRRKRHQKPEAEGDFEPPPGTQPGGVTVTAITDTGEEKKLDLEPTEADKTEDPEKPIGEPGIEKQDLDEADADNEGLETEI